MLYFPHATWSAHVATVVVATFVQPGSIEAAAIATEFWKLHSQPKDAWTAEVTYTA